MSGPLETEEGRYMALWHYPLAPPWVPMPQVYLPHNFYSPTSSGDQPFGHLVDEVEYNHYPNIYGVNNGRKRRGGIDMGYVEEESFGHVPITSTPSLYGPYPIGGSGSNLSMWRAVAEGDCVGILGGGKNPCPDDHPYLCGCGPVVPNPTLNYKCCKYASGDVVPGNMGYGCDCKMQGKGVAPEPQPREPTDAERDAQKAKQIASDVWQKYNVPIVGCVIGIALIGYFMYKRRK